jgi:hypothetical protein
VDVERDGEGIAEKRDATASRRTESASTHIPTARDPEASNIAPGSRHQGRSGAR